jgi:transposase
MRDTQLYQQILGLSEPWHVQRIDLQIPTKQVHVFVEHRPGVVWCCPVCGRELAGYDHAEERQWRHLDTCQFQTLLHARIPRVNCPEHGVVQVRVPWAEARSRFTLLMERLIIDVIQACATITGACAVLGTSWEETWGVMQRAVARGLARKPERVIRHVGVDEKAFRKGQSYMTVVCDLEQATVEHVAEDRRTESLAGYFQGLTPAQREGIEAVAMDMWTPYVQATLQNLPLAAEKIVFDPFHVIGHMNRAVDQVRRAEHRQLMEQGDDTLKGTKYLWLYAQRNLPDEQKPRLAELRRGHLKVARAWALKEALLHLWTYASEGWARRFFAGWYGWARRSALEPVKKVAWMIRQHLDQIMSYHRHHVTNGVAEGLNSKIMTIKRKACGFRSKENFKTAIYFHCGGLELYPC